MDPRARQRTSVTTHRPNVREDLTNDQLLERFAQAVQAGMNQKALEHYLAALRDATRYFRTSEGEVPVGAWSKEAIWTYLDYVMNNYCASFQQLNFENAKGAKCAKRVWTGIKPAEEAVRANCSGCLLFKQPGVRHRINALGKWFKYLARIGAVAHNIMLDVTSEYYEEHKVDTDIGERRRNPSPDEMRRLVNGTLHPQRRAFYASSAKWWFRPNEMFMLDRYASFGIQPPAGVLTPRGFEKGHAANPQVEGFDKGGSLVFLPRSKGKTDKRKGNRWNVVDTELRPILEQHLAWWERTVQRDHEGRPVTTALWLNAHGRALQQRDMYPRLFYEDCERLGLMRASEGDAPGDRENPLRRWTGHCQRHFGEQVRQMANVPPDWNNHFRGDRFKDARGSYFEPKPEQVQAKYHELIPTLGFQPLAGEPRARGSEADVHHTILKAELTRVATLPKKGLDARSVRIRSNAGETWTVPRKLAASILFGLRAGRAGHELRIEPDVDALNERQWFNEETLRGLYRMALTAFS